MLKPVLSCWTSADRYDEVIPSRRCSSSRVDASFCHSLLYLLYQEICDVVSFTSADYTLSFRFHDCNTTHFHSFVSVGYRKIIVDEVSLSFRKGTLIAVLERSGHFGIQSTLPTGLTNRLLTQRRHSAVFRSAKRVSNRPSLQNSEFRMHAA